MAEYKLPLVRLREYLPLKQGLRLRRAVLLHGRSDSPRVSSIKTRIKTYQDIQYNLYQTLLREYLPLEQGLRHLRAFQLRKHVDSPRVSSIKTRIKTAHGIVKVKIMIPPRVSSIKTRIKTGFNCHSEATGNSPRVSSIKTRIKTKYQFLLPRRAHSLREYLPLEQGLRLWWEDSIPDENTCSESIFH